MTNMPMVTSNLIDATAAMNDSVLADIGGGGAFALFFRGGGFMWPILICSVVALAFIFERLVSLRRSVIYPSQDAAALRELVQAGQIDEAIDYCEGHRSPFASVLHACLVRAESQGFEMEAAALFTLAARAYAAGDDVRAACILTVTDTLSEEESSDDTYLPLDALEKATDTMIEVALEAGLSI